MYNMQEMVNYLPPLVKPEHKLLWNWSVAMGAPRQYHRRMIQHPNPTLVVELGPAIYNPNPEPNVNRRLVCVHPTRSEFNVGHRLYGLEWDNIALVIDEQTAAPKIIQFEFHHPLGDLSS